MGASQQAVLVVEDEPLLRMDLALALRESGLRVIEASTADEALVALEAHAIELMLTDVQMPGSMDGLELARWVRAHRPGLLVAVWSGRKDAVAEASSICEEGLVFPKPADPSLVIAAVLRALEGRQRTPADKPVRPGAFRT